MCEHETVSKIKFHLIWVVKSKEAKVFEYDTFQIYKEVQFCYSIILYRYFKIKVWNSVLTKREKESFYYYLAEFILFDIVNIMLYKF